MANQVNLHFSSRHVPFHNFKILTLHIHYTHNTQNTHTFSRQWFLPHHFSNQNFSPIRIRHNQITYSNQKMIANQPIPFSFKIIFLSESRDRFKNMDLLKIAVFTTREYFYAQWLLLFSFITGAPAEGT